MRNSPTGQRAWSNLRLPPEIRTCLRLVRTLRHRRTTETRNGIVRYVFNLWSYAPFLLSRNTSPWLLVTKTRPRSFRRSTNKLPCAGWRLCVTRNIDALVGKFSRLSSRTRTYEGQYFSKGVGGWSPITDLNRSSMPSARWTGGLGTTIHCLLVLNITKIASNCVLTTSSFRLLPQHSMLWWYSWVTCNDVLLWSYTMIKHRRDMRW